MAEGLAFALLFAASLTHWVSPPSALVLGIAFAFFLETPRPTQVRAATKWLLQASVVGLGFGMDLRQVLEAGLGGLAYTAGGIAFAMGAGLLLGRRLRVPGTIAYLISTGTAICGGSAIAAVGPVLGADHDEMAVPLGVVFLLNSAALLLFPAIGAALGLTQRQFGLWAALAIHDTSSVVGAAVKYGAGALAVGATVKLARALWIVPLTLATAALRKSKARVAWPWFILFFVLAAGIATYLPWTGWAGVYGGAKRGLTATLFLIGTGLSKSTLRAVGARPFLMGLLLWLLVASLSLGLISAGLIR